MDHAWCPRLLLFLPQAQAAQAEPIREMLARDLPP